MEEKLLYKIIVSGRVQGVGFRRYVTNEARFLGLKGYVKNLPDGDVYIEAEGTNENLNVFVTWIKKGPGFSFVESVKADYFPPVNYSGFRIEY
jgi:acylphosphatase